MSERSESRIEETDLVAPDSEFDALMQHGITQKITRMQHAGTETIVGVFRCDFESGQNRYILNIPIHPALQCVPEVESVVFEEGFRVRTTDCEKFGVRLELANAEISNESRTIFIETVITASLEN